MTSCEFWTMTTARADSQTDNNQESGEAARGQMSMQKSLTLAGDSWVLISKFGSFKKTWSPWKSSGKRCNTSAASPHAWLLWCIVFHSLRGNQDYYATCAFKMLSLSWSIVFCSGFPSRGSRSSQVLSSKFVKFSKQFKRNASSQLEWWNEVENKPCLDTR